jgi:AbrB family looped-hinge helix DNA binding protein
VSKVTSKRQVTVPKAIADRFGIRPGAKLEWVVTGEHIRVVLAGRAKPATIRERLRTFDEATGRQRARELGAPEVAATTGRGWTRDELYDRGRAR